MTDFQLRIIDILNGEDQLTEEELQQVQESFGASLTCSTIDLPMSSCD